MVGRPEGGRATDYKVPRQDWRGYAPQSILGNMETEDTPLPAHKPAFLRRVQIRGYKSIAFCDVTLEPLTVLVGRNASGKSNFLDALGFLRDVVKYGVREAVKQHGGADAILCKSIVNCTTVRFEIDCCFEAVLIVELKTPSKRWLTQYRLDISFQNLSNPVISLEACHCKPDDGTPSEKFSAKDGRFNMPERVP